MQVSITTRLKERLDELERSAAWLSRKIGRSEQQVGAYVNGKIVPRYELQVLIAETLNSTVTDIWPAEITQ